MIKLYFYELSLKKIIFDCIKGSINQEKKKIKMHQVNVRVIEARSLAVSDVTGSSDPFVVVTFDGKKIGKTEVKTKTLNPFWDERFTHICTVNFTEDIRVTVYDKDFIANDHLGYVNIPVIYFRDELWTESWYRLVGSGDIECKGYIKLGIHVCEYQHIPFLPNEHNIECERAHMLVQKLRKENALIHKMKLFYKQIVDDKTVNDDNADVVIPEFKPCGCIPPDDNAPRIDEDVFNNSVNLWASKIPFDYRKEVFEMYIANMNDKQIKYYCDLSESDRGKLFNRLLFQQIMQARYYKSLNQEQKKFYEKQMENSRNYIKKISGQFD